MKHCEFGKAILFSDAPVAGPFEAIKTAKLDSTAAYSTFLFKHLPSAVETPFVLIVQWDGYVTDPAAWRESFRRYDYIGARWRGAPKGRSVGNGGFSLMSQKLMSTLAKPRFVLDENVNSDWQICCTLRPLLERQHGIRFATERVADKFSHENIEPSAPTFGFHGMGNMWRHVEDAEMVQLIDELDPYVMQTGHCGKLLRAYFARDRLDPLRAIHARMTRHMGSEDIRQLILSGARDEALALACADFLHALPRERN